MDFLFVFAASAVTLLLVGPAKAIAHKLRLLDYPSERKIHASPIPRAGGLVVIPVVITVCLLRQAVTGKPCLSSLNFPLVGGSVLLIYAAGLADDRWGLRARHKFLVQFVSSLAAVLGGAGFSGVAIPYDGALSLPPFLASILTVFWLSGLTNAYNLLDGMDGLFSTVSGSAALFISFAGFLLGNTEAAAVAAILGASLFSLIPENSPPARIFPGDSASMTTGFLLGLLTLLCLRKPSGEVELFPALLFHGVALYDTAFVFTKRLLEKRSPFLPGLDHIHHRVLDFTGSVGKSLLTIISLHLLLSFLGFSLLFREATLPALAVTGLLATALLSWRKIRRLFLVAAGVRKKDSPGG